MPNTVLSRTFLIMLLILGNTLLVSANYAYSNTLIFTDHTHPVINTGNYPVFYLDGPTQIEAKLSEGLSNDPVEAKQQALKRIQDSQMQQALINAYQGVNKAWQLGITKLPAVVVNERYVVYGVSDVNQAMQLVKEYKE